MGIQVNLIYMAKARIHLYHDVMMMMIIAMKPMMPDISKQVKPISIASVRIHRYKGVIIMMIIAMDPMMRSYTLAYRSIPFL